MIKLGSRSSKLATWQAHHVQAELLKKNLEVEIVFLTTEGDQSQQSLTEFGGQGAFTRRIQQALLSGEIDFAVHSLKDLPTEPIEGLTLAAVPCRESPVDVWVAQKSESLAQAEPGTLIGTGSLRRQAQLLHQRKDVRVKDIRGNVDTRLRKLDAGEYDALVLAKAGLARLGLSESIQSEFSISQMLPAIGQGALGLECRSDDADTLNALVQINESNSHTEVLSERALLRTLRAGCLAPVGAYARVNPTGTLDLSAVVLSRDGSQRVFGESSGPLADPEKLGVSLANELISNGAQKLLDRS
ncbi:MAG: hydroxymethylbilane synthase [Planctomycetota bacterium]|nr:hydroxymethylbilane synthase [Planctomycetota bacterium]